MEVPCDNCGVVRALVYCKSDMARLCLRCDESIHSANPLSRRHPRSLICNKCVSQPAVILCLDERLSFCQGCYRTGHTSCSILGHTLQAVNPYLGCPSLAESARMWSLVSEPSLSSSGFGQGWVGSVSGCLEQRDGLVKKNEMDGWIGSSSSSSMLPHNPNFAPFFYEETNLPKGCSDSKDVKAEEGEDICEGLNMDDVPLNFDASEDILGCPQGPTKCHRFEDAPTECLLLDNDSSVTESNGPLENTLEASSSGQTDCIAYQSSQISGSAANLLQPMNSSGNSLIGSSSCSRGINLGFAAPGQAHSNMSLSLSNITGESSANDYQDCGLSPGFFIGESAWESNLEGSCPQARQRAKIRYNDKKSKRTFGKQIRYASRKERADTRKRVKGRFVKAGEAYDYDPVPARNFRDD